MHAVKYYVLELSFMEEWFQKRPMKFWKVPMLYRLLFLLEILVGINYAKSRNVLQ